MKLIKGANKPLYHFINLYIKINNIMPKNVGDLSLFKEDCVKIIQKDLLKGVFRTEILTRLTDDYYGFGSNKWDKATRYNYIKTAYDGLKIEQAETREKEKELMYGRYVDVYNECRNRGDRREALNALNNLTKLMGLAEPDQVTHQGMIEINFNLVE